MAKSKNIKDYVCFDLETTGFGRTTEIIEIGAVKVRNDVITDTFSELVKPVHRISSEITQITGISQNDVSNCRGISEVIVDFIRFIENDILVGHNIASFDIPIIRRIVMTELEQPFNVQYIDTLHLARHIDGVPDHKLQTMLDYFGIVNERAHRAFEDCKANHQLFQALEQNGIKAIPSYSSGNSENENREVRPKEHLEVRISEDVLDTVCDKIVVLTGDFEFGSRKDIEIALTNAGAIVRNSVGKKTDYLIVGCLGSEQWFFDNGGRKIQAAQEMGIKIISEIAINNILAKSEGLCNV